MYTPIELTDVRKGARGRFDGDSCNKNELRNEGAVWSISFAHLQGDLVSREGPLAARERGLLQLYTRETLAFCCVSLTFYSVAAESGDGSH